MRRFNIDVAETLESLQGKEAANRYVTECIRRDCLKRLGARLRRTAGFIHVGDPKHARNAPKNPPIA